MPTLRGTVRSGLQPHIITFNIQLNGYIIGLRSMINSSSSNKCCFLTAKATQNTTSKLSLFKRIWFNRNTKGSPPSPDFDGMRSLSCISNGITFHSYFIRHSRLLCVWHRCPAAPSTPLIHLTKNFIPKNLLRSSNNLLQNKSEIISLGVTFLSQSTAWATLVKSIAAINNIFIQYSNYRRLLIQFILKKDIQTPAVVRRPVRLGWGLNIFLNINTTFFVLIF